MRDQVKLCTVWRGEGHDAEAPTRDPITKIDSAAIERRPANTPANMLSAFAACVEREHQKCRAPVPPGAGARSASDAGIYWTIALKLLVRWEPAFNVDIA